MVEYLPCSTNTWELFGINQTTVLEEYLDTSPEQSCTTSSHHHNNEINDLNAFGEFEEVFEQKNCGELNMNVDLASTASSSSAPCSEYLGNYIVLANHIVESRREESMLLFQCSLCGDGLRPLTSNEGTCHGKDTGRTYLCMKCDRTAISLNKVEPSSSRDVISVQCQNGDCKLKNQSVAKKPSNSTIFDKSYTLDSKIIKIIDSNNLKGKSSSSRNRTMNKNQNNDKNTELNDKKLDTHMDHIDCSDLLNYPLEVKGGREGKFGSVNQFQQQNSVHVKDKAFACNICGKEFKWNGNLKVHLRIHSGERPFHCEVCGKQFNASNDLRRHKRRHTGEMPYKCSTCSMSFKSNSEMKQHAKIHQEHRPHQCSECGKSFMSRSNLKTHLRVHSGERPYKCLECSRTFGTSTNLKNHQRIHSGIKPYICPVCGKQFSQSNNLNIHKKKHERSEDE